MTENPDRQPLKAKEPIVLDAEGNTVFVPDSEARQQRQQQHGFGTGKVHVFRLGGPMGLLLLLLVPLLLVGGFLVFAVVAAGLILLWSLRAITRALLGR